MAEAAETVNVEVELTPEQAEHFVQYHEHGECVGLAWAETSAIHDDMVNQILEQTTTTLELTYFDGSVRKFDGVIEYDTECDKGAPEGVKGIFLNAVTHEGRQSIDGLINVEEVDSE